MGAGVTISTRPGYLPCVALDARSNEVLTGGGGGWPAPAIAAHQVPPGSHLGSSTDVGDLQHIMPVLQFWTGGYAGIRHGADFTVVDEDIYYILTAKMFCADNVQAF